MTKSQAPSRRRRRTRHRRRRTYHWGPNSLLPSLLSCGSSVFDLTVGCCINSLQDFNHPTHLFEFPLRMPSSATYCFTTSIAPLWKRRPKAKHSNIIFNLLQILIDWLAKSIQFSSNHVISIHFQCTIELEDVIKTTKYRQQHHWAPLIEFDYPLPVEPRDLYDVGSEFLRPLRKDIFLRWWRKSTYTSNCIALWPWLRCDQIPGS